ncbi:ribosomal protein S14, S11 [Turnera subulata]|uniref:Small ribosomal subunit protein uS14m n=1 Tax=Turnera subulata TaxID=218843 RepID=A0A9Q0FFQ0_9ROSI|nr:ribosomal protein S14, S11 [Turnera subulata]
MDEYVLMWHMTVCCEGGKSCEMAEPIQRENRNIKDNHRRQLAAKYELRRNLFKALVRDPELPTEMRENASAKLAALPRNSSFTRVRNRCIFSGRPRGVYEVFRMSRLVFRALASRGMLAGVKKASW